MKTIHNINKWSFIITLLLYMTVILGLLSQILLGFIQVIIAIIIFSKWKQHTYRIRKYLIIYFSIVALYGVFWLLGIAETFNTNSMVMDPSILYLCIIPMSIAAYFVYVTYQIKKSAHELKLDYI
ncbi:hypothetical protein [uncultured Aquimarina sp.]|uniref:hypothetical protein n=1 Tax=uncultured Aquimarina sp. TaxID=575652 RepID=UPI00262BF924|nr:hypothetical protein [uncultured Aquimarina sp.]